VIANCDLNTTEKQPIRTLTTTDGSKIVERKTNWNDRAHAYSYMILESPLPVEKYHSTIKVLALNLDKSEIIWSAVFSPKGSPADADKAITGIFIRGLESLKRRLDAAN
jgi:hypothetical protein